MIIDNVRMNMQLYIFQKHVTYKNKNEHSTHTFFKNRNFVCILIHFVSVDEALLFSLCVSLFMLDMEADCLDLCTAFSLRLFRMKAIP